MGEGFAEAAERLAWAAGSLLGWRPPEFWEATPQELATALTAPEQLAGSPLGGEAITRLKERFPDG